MQKQIKQELKEFPWEKVEAVRLEKVIKKILRKLNTSLSIETADIIHSIEYFKLALDPTQYTNAAEFSVALFASELLSKSKGFYQDLDPDHKGRVKFVESEIKCRETNKRIYMSVLHPMDEDVESAISAARRKIALILGPIVNIDDLSLPSWGPGVTKTIRGRYVNAQKLAEYPFRISTLLWKLHSSYMSASFPYLNSITGIKGEGPYCVLYDSYEPDDIANIVLVPKTSKVSRPITVEPTCNVSMTSVLGDYLRKRLKWNGIDLTCQERNRSLALKALDLGLGTVDLSSASDCIAIMLIQDLFPPAWSDLILRFRTSRYRDGDTSRTFEKFAGMGNGVTFPLETIIFYALSYGVNHIIKPKNSTLSVYGDDIIIASESVPLLIKVMDFCGFSVNKDKTHYEPHDLYRESCGMQVFDGVDVTPVYIKEVNKDQYSCLRNHNRLYRWLVKEYYIDLLPILGTLRPDNANTLIVGTDIPEEDHFYFLYRGKSNGLKLLDRRKSFIKVKAIDFLWWRLLLLEKTSKDWDSYLTMHLQDQKSYPLISKKVYKQSIKVRSNFVLMEGSIR